MSCRVYELSRKYTDDKAIYSLEAIANVDEGILFVNKDDLVVFCNKAAAKSYREIGFEKDIVGATYRDICIVKENEDELNKNVTVNYVELGDYYFKIKRVNVIGDELRFIVIISDITLQKTQERKLALKSVAFKEMHHRIKNNLQTIVSLLRLQRNKLEYCEGKNAIDDTISRILAISSTHEILMASDINMIKLNDTIEKVANNFKKYSQREDFNLEIEVNGGAFEIEVDRATAITLIINELMENSLKHAFKGKTHGSINISVIEIINDEIEIIFKDDGCGFDLKSVDLTSMGLTIVNSMVRETLKGNIIVKSDNTGTEARIIFKI